jgi:adenine phosphoribosyltransferase
MDLKSYIRNVPDFPKPGINFKDITTLLKDKMAFDAAIDAMLAPFAEQPVDYYVGIESRGFIFAAAMAIKNNAGFVPVRKPGKLPARTLKEDYALEYGTDTIEIHADAIAPGASVVLVDDLLATGGTAKAALNLLDQLDANILGAVFLIELDFLKGIQKLDGYDIHSILHF